MNGSRARSQFTFTIAGMVIALGAAIDTAYGQFVPMCALNKPGCNAILNCTGGGGNCTGAPPRAYNVSNQTGIPYKTCTAGNVPDCPNPLPPVPFCTVNGYTFNNMGNCAEFICTVTIATPGC